MVLKAHRTILISASSAPDRVRDVEHLYIAGSSVFPTGGQANPTLPAVALALRLAEHLAGVKRRQGSSAPAADQTVERAS